MKTPLALFFFLTCTLVYGQAPRLVVPMGHIDQITSTVFSPDGKSVLTGSYDQTAKRWDLQGRELQTFAGHDSGVMSVAFSPDGNSVLTGCGDTTAKLWDLQGRVLQTFSGHFAGAYSLILSVAFSPDGKSVLTGSSDSTAKLWDLQGQELQTFAGHADIVNSVAFSPDGKSVLTGSYDNTAILWDLQGRVLQTFAGHSHQIFSVAFSPDGKSVLTGSEDLTAKLWDLQGRKLQTFTGHGDAVHSVAFSPDGKSVLTGSRDYTAKLWDLQGRELQTFAGYADWVNSVAFSPDGMSVLTGSGDHTTILWDLQGRKLQTFGGHAFDVYSAAFSPDGKSVLTGSDSRTAKLWDLQGRKLQTFAGPSDNAMSVAFSPDGKSVLAGSWENTAKLWDLQGQELQTFAGHGGSPFSLAFSPDGKFVLTGCNDETAKLWDLQGRELQTFAGHADWVHSVAFSPDGKSVLTGSNDHTAKLWDLQGREIQTFEGHTEPVWSVAFSPDGKTVLTSSWDNTAKLWDLQGREIQTFEGHTKPVWSAVFSPDGTSVLTGSWDETSKLWDLQGRELQTFKGHSANSVAFSPDGKIILTGGPDKTTKFWNPKTGQELATLIAIDSADWVVTTSSGLFDASSGALSLMHYMVGLEVIDLEQLKERYYEPGLLAKVLGFSDEPLRSVSGFDSIALYPKLALQLDTAQNKLYIRLQPRNGGLGKVSIFVNGKEVIEDANPPQGFEKIRDTALTLELDKYVRYFLFDSLNTVSVRVYNQAGWLKSAPQHIQYRPDFARSKGGDQGNVNSPKPLNRKPALHALVVGTADYAGVKLDLKYSGKDARDMAGALQQVGNQLFGTERVSIQLLTTDTSQQSRLPTKTNIKAAFENIKSSAKAEDILIVYFSGHGISYGDADRALFYYLTMDIGSENLSDAGVRDGRTISSEELTRWINDIPAQKQVLILDACNSGRVVENMASGQKELNSSQIRALDRMKDRTGMFVLTGSAADKVSYEAGQYGQGLLTYSLLQGMSGLALTSDKRVDVSTLFNFARDLVPNLAKGIGGIQAPMLVGPTSGSFDIGIVNEQVKIPLAQVKPVFIRNNFQDEYSFDDVLGLTKALADYFEQITARGAQADLIYVDVSEYENAYSIKGRYNIRGNDVTVRGRLFQGKISKGAFSVKGKKDKLPALVETLVDKVSGML